MDEARQLAPDQVEVLRAQLDLQKDLDDKPAQSALLLSLAELAAGRGLIGKQIDYLRSAWYLSPEETSIGDTLADIHLARGDESAAIEALSHVIETHQKAGQEKAVRETYERILSIRPTEAKIRFQLAEHLLEQQDIQIACEHLQRIVKQFAGQLPPSDPDLIPVLESTYRHLIDQTEDIDYQRQLGDFYRATDDFPAAGCAYYEVLQQCPDDEPEIAIETCRQILDIAPGESSIEKQLAALYQKAGRQKDAGELYRGLWEKYWQSWSAAGEQQPVTEGALVDRVIETAEQLSQLQPEDDTLHYRMAEFYTTIEQTDQAITHWIALGEIYTEHGDKNQAAQTYRRILEIQPDLLEVRIRLAEVLESQGQLEEALEEHLRLGSAYQEQKQWEQARSAFQRAADMAPSNPAALSALLEIAQTQDDHEGTKTLLLQLAELGNEELDRLKTCLELDPSDQAVRERYLQSLIRSEEWVGATEQLQQLVSEYSEQNQYDLALGLLERSREHFTEQIEISELLQTTLENQLNSAQQENQPPLVVERISRQLNVERMACAENLQVADRSEDAENLLKKVIQADEDNDEARHRLLKLLQEGGELSDANRKLSAKLWQQLGDIYSKRGLLEDAQNAYSETLNLSPRARIARQRLATLNAERGAVEDSIAQQRQLAQQALDDSDWNRAAEALEEVLKIQPGDEQTLEQLAKTYLKLDDQFKAWEKAESLLLSVERRQDSEAVLKWADFILKLDPTRSDILQRQIGAYIQLGQQQEAAEGLWQLAELLQGQEETEAEQSACVRLLELDLERFDLHRKAALRLFDLGMQQRGRRELERLARRSIEQNRLADTLEIYSLLHEQYPKETEYLLALAEGYTKAGQGTQALQHRLSLHEHYLQLNRPVEMVSNLRAALELAPEQARIHGLLGEVFADLGNYREAIERLMAAAERSETEQDRLHAAQYYRTVLKVDSSHLEALRCFNRLQTGCALDDTEREELMKVRCRLVRLLTQEGKAAVPEIDKLAEALQADYENDETILKVLAGAYREIESEKAIDLSLHLLEQELRRKDWSEAEKTLAKIRQGGGLTPEHLQHLLTLCQETPLQSELVSERTKLAEAYIARQDREAAIEQYRILVESDIEPILHRQALIENLDIAGHHDHSRKEKLALADLLRQQGRPREAMAWVNSALNYEKDDLECLGLLSDLLLEINSLQEARPVIRKMAAVAEEHGDFLKAEEYLQKLIDLFPEDGDLQEEMARLQLERGQRERGLESLVQAAETFAEAGQIERAITLYEKAISQQDDGIDIRRKLIALLLQKGLRQEALAQERAIIDWHLQRDEIQQAVAGYEQLIESDPQDLSLPQEMADMLLRAGQTERAVEVLFRLAEICRLREMLKRAQDTFQQILSLQPVHEQARRRLAEIYIEKGMEEEGQSELLELAKQIEAGEIKKPAPEDDLDALGNWILEINPGNTSILLPLAQLIQPMRKRKPEWGAGLWSRIHISLGLQYLSRGEANEAQRCIKEIETATPSHPELVSLKERLEQLQRFQLPQETFRENLRKAQEHWELGEYGTAAQLYEQLLKSQPRDIELILRLAEAYQRQGQRPKAIDWLESRGRDFASERNFDSARQCFHQCLDLQPERLEIHTALADLALAEDRLDTAVEQYLHLADLVESPQALPQAIRALEKAHDIAPENEEVLQRLAAHYQKSKDIEKARETLRALAQLARKKHQIEGAIAALQEALAIGEQQPSIAGVPQKELLRQNISLHQEIAEALIQQGKPALAAENLISAGQTALLAEVFETAQTCFEQVLQLPEHKLEPTIIQRTYEGLTEALTQSGKPEKAAETLAQLAQFHDSRKHIDKALDALQQAHQLAPEQRSHLEQLCQACLTADREEDYIRFSLKLAQLLLARDLIGRAEAVYRTLRAMKRWDKPDLAPDQGEPCYREILQPLLNLCLDKGATDDAIELQSDLANRYLNTGDIEEAEKHYQQILKLQSDHEPTLEQLVQVYQGQQRHAEAIETLRKLASVAETRGYPPQALDLLFQILDIEPDHAQALRDIERLAQVPGQTQTAIQELRNRFGQHFKSNNSRAVQAIGGLILRLDPAAEKIRIQLPEAFVWDKESKKAVDHFDQLGQRYRKQSQPELAKQCFIRALEIDPDREQIQNQIAEIDQQLNQEEKTERRKKVREQIEEVLQSNEPTRVFEILESNIQKDRDDTQLADWTADLYEKAIEGKAPFSRKADAGHRKQWLAGATTIRLKRTHEFQKDGDLTKARNQLSRILALDPENEEAGNLQLRILSELGQTDALLQLGRQMASAYRGKGQWQAAVDLYRRLEQYTPATPALLGEMATALVKMGQPGEAATVYRRQADLFLKDELYAQALSAYNEILSLLPDDQETLEGLLAVYVLRGDVRGALTYGRRILDQHLKRNDYPAAEAMLQRMIELDPNQPSLRREKIELLRREGKEDLLIREMEALSDFYTEGELLSKAIEVLREILEVAPDRRSIHERLIEGLLQTGQTAAAAEQYLQAAEYWQVRDESLAGQCLQEALQLQPDNPDIIKPYAEYLARVGRKAECRDQMDHLARILEDRKDWPAAARVREKMIRIVPEDGSILEPLVQLYEKMKQPEKAGPLMETLARNMEAEEKTDEAVEAYLQAAQYFYEAGVGTK